MMRECAEGGCRALVVKGRCDKHTHGDNSVKAQERQHRQLRSLYDPFHKLYKTARWLRVRVEVLMDNPACVLCTYAIAHHVDHKIPARIYCKDDPNKFYDKSNLQSLCLACHGKKSREEQTQGLTAQTSPTPNKT